MDRRVFVLGAAAATFASTARAAPGDPPFTVDAFILLRSFQAVIEYQVADIMRSLHQMAAGVDGGDWKTLAPTLKAF